MRTVQTDLLVVGAGLAGERVAVTAAAAGHDVVILSLVPPRRSHSSAAQGGMQAALGNCAMGLGDNPDVHFADTVKGSDWGCEQDVARLFCETAPIAVREMAAWGVPWNRVTAGRKKLPSGIEVEDLPEKEGLITARDFGGTQKWRTTYVSDGTGHSLLYTMDNVVVKLGVTVHDRREMISLIHDGERCYGAVVRNHVDGSLQTYLARATVLATGGYGRLYGATTNAVICEGTGMAVAQDTGVVPLGNMEAVQFHPTGIVPTDILVTEGCRGDGGYLLDKNEERFMPGYEPAKKELASRDVVSRRMSQHMNRGLGVDSPFGTHLWLDIRHLGEEHITTYLREVKDICRNFLSIDPVRELIPVRPTQHYSMGGVRTNADGAAYGLAGLFAAGETACWDMHGFNRLGGNSLAETIVAGKIVGEKVSEYLEGTEVSFPTGVAAAELARQQERIDRLLKRAKGENVFVLRTAMEEALMTHVPIFRHGDFLRKGAAALEELLARAESLALQAPGGGASSPELTAALRLPGMLRLALSIAYGALGRTESRGSHFREDFPQRDDENWLKRTLAYWPGGSSRPRLEYEGVTITELPPGDRGYGEATSAGKDGES
jgi:fumarate reductase flavoprotein subunit